MLTVLALLTGCGGRVHDAPPPPAEAVTVNTWSDPRSVQWLRDARGLHRQERLIAERAVGVPTWTPDGGLVTTAVRAQGAVHLVVCAEAKDWSCSAAFQGPGTPEHPTLSADGSRIAFVWAGPTGGWAGVFVVPTAGGEPRRLTNGNASLGPNGPVDYLPVPEAGSLRWEGETLHWTSGGFEFEAPATP